MNFLLTTYFYPLAEEIELSQSLAITLDNPRSQDEVDYIAAYLESSHKNSPDRELPTESQKDVVSLEWVLSNFQDNFSKHDPFLTKFFKKCSKENIYHRLAKMWIIARYDDEGEHRRLQDIHCKMREKGEVGFILLEDDHPIIKAKKRLNNFLSLLSLLVHSEKDDYYGRQILADEELSDLERHAANRNVWLHHFRLFMIQATSKDWMTREDSLDWTLFPKIKDKLIATSNMIERSMISGEADTLLHVGSVLKIAASGSREDTVKILLLTSILEFLLTHNPDNTRFNVEDSINKQFQLKTAVLLYINDHQIDIDQVKEKLKQLYRVRSCIAHGNFDEMNKLLAKLSEKYKDKVYISDFVTDLYAFIRAVLEVRLKDTKFVTFLKEG